MKLKVLLAGSVAALALAVLGSACGGDDDGGAVSIRTQKGLAVAAVSGQLDQTGGRSAGSLAPVANGAAESDRSSTGADLGFKGVDYAPALQASQAGITVQGYGSATTDPDSAIIEFYFNRSSGTEPKPVPEPGSTSSGSGSSSVAPDSVTRDSDAAVAAQVDQIKEADLQPVIDALVAAGVSRGDIEFIGQAYYDVYSASATLRAKVGNVDNVDAVVQAAQTAAANLGDIYLSSTNVSYTVSDCAALEKAAMDAAVADAKERATSFATSLGVGLGDIVGASHYSYAPYGGTACDGNFAGPYPMGGVAYAEGSTPSVQVFANISVTYAIQ